ncbi:MAG: hypothetical protein ACREX4_01730 [Gammaproteobacteria bacterium]
MSLAEHRTIVDSYRPLTLRCRSFFDPVDHDWMMRFLEHRIADKRVLRLIRKWLTADVVEDGKKTDVRVGTQLRKYGAGRTLR